MEEGIEKVEYEEKEYGKGRIGRKCGRKEKEYFGNKENNILKKIENIKEYLLKEYIIYSNRKLLESQNAFYEKTDYGGCSFP